MYAKENKVSIFAMLQCNIKNTVIVKHNHELTAVL